MRILIYNWKDLAHPLAGGAEVYTEGFARDLAARGHEVTIFASAVSGRAADEHVQGVRIIRRGGRLTVYREARRYWLAEGDGMYDVVVDEVNTRPFLTPRYIRATPIVALIHQLARDVWRYESPLPVALVGRYVLEPSWLRSYRGVRVMTDSPSSARSFEDYGIYGAHPLPIGAPRIEVPELPKEPNPTVVFVGRLVKSKRPKDIMDAFTKVRHEIPDARLWVVGDGPDRIRLMRVAPDGTQFLGRVSTAEREARLTRAHVLVSASVREGWGLTVSEASLCGTPAIAYDAPGLVDSVPASGGHLVDPHPDALATALVAFFCGQLPLIPVPKMVQWSTVADAVEQHLRAAIDERPRARAT
jgi:glycosyltransferase involved in cell wall biosynthesis